MDYFYNNISRYKTKYLTARLLLLFIIVIISSHPATAASNSNEPLVKITKATLENINPPEKFIGHIEAIETVSIVARVAGYLEKVNFKEGSIVKKNSLLYIIEQAPYLARVTSNQGLVEQAKADLFKANQKLNRLLTAQPESVPATDLDDAKAQKDYAEGLLKEAQANLKLSLIDLDYTTITAPINGRIGKTRYTEGNYVNASSEPLAVIHQLNPIRVVFSLGENKVHHLQNYLRDIKENNEENFINPEIYFSDGSKYTEKGLIDFIDNSVDPSTGTIAVWVLFENQEHKLIPGEYVTIFLTLDKPDLKVLIPLEAVQMDNKGSFVFTVNKESIVEERRITTGKQLEDKWIVKNGLKEGDIVVVQGIQKIRPGIKVKTSSLDVEENH